MFWTGRATAVQHILVPAQSPQVFLAFLKLKIRTEIIILLNNGIFRFNLKVTTTMYAGLFSTVYYYRYFRHAEADKRTYLLAYLLTSEGISIGLRVFVQEQKRRYIEIKQSDLPMAVAAKRTREFRCPPQEQVYALTLSVRLSVCLSHTHSRVDSSQVKVKVRSHRKKIS